VTESRQSEREVYLPKGSTWTNAWTGETIEGGVRICVNTPLEQIPLFTTNGYKILL
jgi:alpha-D-xyloside xylohydrolase